MHILIHMKWFNLVQYIHEDITYVKYTGEILAAMAAENGMWASITETGTPQTDDLRKNIFCTFHFHFLFH